jgi:hypothetical protein
MKLQDESDRDQKRSRCREFNNGAALEALHLRRRTSACELQLRAA